MSEIIFKEKPLWTLEEPIVLNPEETQTFSLPSSIKTAAKFLTLQQEVVRNGATEYQFNVKSSINCIIEYKSEKLSNENYMILFNRDIEENDGYFINTSTLNLQGNDVEKITLTITNNSPSELLEIVNMSIFESDDVQVTTIAKVIQEDTIVSDIIHVSTIIADEALVQECETGIKERDARNAKVGSEVHWIRVSGNSISYGIDVLGSETEQLSRTVLIAGVEYTYNYWYTSIEGKDAFKYLTTRDPLERHPDMPDSERDKFKYMVLKPESSDIKKSTTFALDENDNYTPTDVYGSGYGKEDSNAGKGFVYKNTNGFYNVYVTVDSVKIGWVMDDNGLHINGWADQYCEFIEFKDNGVKYKFVGEETRICEYIVDENDKLTGLLHNQEFLTTISSSSGSVYD